MSSHINRISEVARQSTVVLLATLAVQLTTFAVTAIAGLMLPIGEFAKLSLITAANVLSAFVLDLGLNVTMTKFYSRDRDASYLRAALAVRVSMLGVATVAGCVLLGAGIHEIGLGLILGGCTNLWSGVRATEQAVQDYRSYARSNIGFAAMRFVSGIAALTVWREAHVVAVAVYAIPMLAMLTSHAKDMISNSFAAIRRPSRQAVGYAAHVAVSQLAFNSVLYVPQFFVEARLSALDVGRYGLVLTFIAPVALVVTSLRNVLLPKLLSSSSKDFDRLLWSWRGVMAVAGLCVLLLIGGGFGAGLVHFIYGTRFPDTVTPFITIYAGSVLTGMIGIYSLSMHTQNAPHLGTWVNLARLTFAILALMYLGNSLWQIAALVSVVMVIGEIVLVALLRARRRV